MAAPDAPELLVRAMFPLEGALLPNQDLPLRIFEPRYGALARHCIATGEPFGVVLISQGREVGGGESRYDVGTLTRIVEYAEQGAGRYILRCRTGERIKVLDWLPDDPYPRATVRIWPDEPGDEVTEAQLLEVEDLVMTLFERIAAVRGVELPGRDVVLGSTDTDAGTDTDAETDSAGERLYALASHIPIGSADRYAVLAAPSAADRLTALREAVESLAEMVEFQLSE